MTHLVLAILGSSFADRLLDIVVIEQMDVGTLGKSIAHLNRPRGHVETAVLNEKKRTFTHHPAELSDIPGIHSPIAFGHCIFLRLLSALLALDRPQKDVFWDFTTDTY